ncbi:MAG: NTP transferase domain-containing protein [Pseudomonadota bacterium]|nr:NTP transferase domain-containing protein [Pseudomonadota bacterium]
MTSNRDINITAIIPAHLASIRFPEKILFPFFGYPMIEHVRRRALLSEKISDVYVATCDQKIAEAVNAHGGKVILTGDHHRNGTSRVAEAVSEIEASHIILLQGDEPLLLPSYVDSVADAITHDPEGDAWNGTGPINTIEEIERHSFVKCAVAPDNHIMFCFRRGPSHAPIEQQQTFTRKILGIIAFRKDFLQKLVQFAPARTEMSDSIEQMRIIENGHRLISVPFDESLPSVNEPDEAEIAIDYMKNKAIQRMLLFRTFGIELS